MHITPAEAYESIRGGELQARFWCTGSAHGHLQVPVGNGMHSRHIKEQIRILADEACCHSSDNRSTFIWNVKTELSVATVKSNALVFQAYISQLARKTGKAFQKGATCPHAEV